MLPILAAEDYGLILLLSFIGFVIGISIFFAVIHVVIRSGVCAGMMDYRKKVEEMEAKEAKAPPAAAPVAAVKAPAPIKATQATVMSGFGGKM